jgi:hypothetical protein
MDIYQREVDRQRLVNILRQVSLIKNRLVRVSKSMRLAIILLVAALAAGAVPPKLSKAEIWSEAVAKFLADPQFYQQVPREQVKYRYLPLIHANQLTFSTSGAAGSGRNLEMGIVYAFTSLRTIEKGEGIPRKQRIESLQLVFQPTDPDGKQIYPLLKAKLLRHLRLRKPVWKLFVDKGEENERAYFFRKGTPEYFIRIDVHNFFALEIALPGPGPFVIVEAGWDEGESEDP